MSSDEDAFLAAASGLPAHAQVGARPAAAPSWRQRRNRLPYLLGALAGECLHGIICVVQVGATGETASEVAQVAVYGDRPGGFVRRPQFSRTVFACLCLRV